MCSAAPITPVIIVGTVLSAMKLAADGYIIAPLASHRDTQDSGGCADIIQSSVTSVIIITVY
jgi:hypothetical protein